VTRVEWTGLSVTLPHSRLVEIPDSYTFVSEDQPDIVAREIAKFIIDTDPTPSATPATGQP